MERFFCKWTELKVKTYPDSGMLVRLFLRTLTMPWNAFIAQERKMENTSFANIRLTCSTKRICGGGNVEQWRPTQCSSESNYREFRGRASQRSALFCSLHSARCLEWYRALWPALWCGICWASTWWVGWWWWFWSALCASSCNWATLLVRAERANWCWHHFIEDYIAISGKYLFKKAPISLSLWKIELFLFLRGDRELIICGRLEEFWTWLVEGFFSRRGDR